MYLKIKNMENYIQIVQYRNRIKYKNHYKKRTDRIDRIDRIDKKINNKVISYMDVMIIKTMIVAVSVYMRINNICNIKHNNRFLIEQI